MIKQFFLTQAFVFIFFGISYAQQTDYKKEIVIKTDSLSVLLQFYSPDIVRVVKTKLNQASAPVSNFSIIAIPARIVLNKITEGNLLKLYTDSICIQVHKKTGEINFLYKNKLLIREDPAVKPLFRKLKDKNDEYKIKQGFLLEKEEPIYGLGQHQKGTMNQRNNMQLLYQNNMEIAMPVFQSVKGYAILWNNESPSLFSDVNNQTYFLSDKGKAVDYFFIRGENTDKVVSGIRQLTGRSPLLPKWAFGFVQSKERYESQEEIVNVVKNYRELGVPLDCIVQDWRYWGLDNKDWNSTRFDNPAFGNPQKMIDDVHKMNAKIIISVWPSFGPNTAIFKSLDKEDFIYQNINPSFPKEGLLYNAFNSKARNIVWDYMEKNLFAKGIDGWWLDATEPIERWDFNTFSDAAYTEQLKPLINQTTDTVAGTPNSYPLYTVGGVADNQRTKQTAKRTFILTRSGYIGQQRYGAIVWSGDITSSWQVMKNQISGALNVGLSGIPYWNADIGGFWSNRFYPKGHKDPAFRELVVRWTQFGAFTALMRMHGTNTPREIYQFGEKGQWSYDAIKKSIDLRYRLLPYTYSTSYQIMTNHASLMRPLFADFVYDKLTYNISDQFLYGKSLLVAPIVERQYVYSSSEKQKTDFENIKTRQVYLPEGSYWIDFWTGENFTGGQYVQKKTPIDIIPVYVKAGSVIPLGDFKQYTSEKDDTILEIRVYPGANGQFTLYEDEGDNYNYEKGNFSTIDFSWDDKKRKLSIGNTKGTYSGALTNRVFNISIVTKENGTGMFPSKNYKTVKYEGKEMIVSL